MIPIRDVIPTRTVPGVTILLIAVNLLAFGLLLAGGDPARGARPFAVIPGAPAWHAVLPSMFVHTGWLHVLANLLVLWIFGDNLEDRMGHGRFLIFYLLCGTLAILVHVASDPRSTAPVFGSSGAVAAVMGAYFRLYRRSRVLALVPVLLVVRVVELPAILFLGAWLIVQLLAGPGVLPGTTYPAGAGGLSPLALLAAFAIGATLVIAFRRPERLRVEWWGTITTASGRRGRRGQARS